MNVLIAEDDLLGGILLERAVSRAGHQVELARDGIQALARAQGDSNFDAVLVDLVMPGLDGLQLLTAIRGSLRPVPILIVTTGQTSSESRARALEAGADDYLTKPFDPRRVVEVLELCHSRRHQVPDPGSARADLACSGPPTANFPCVTIGAGSGGPTALRQLLAGVTGTDVSFLIVQQAPDYILDTLVKMLQSSTRLAVKLAEQGDPVRRGTVYLAPADRHLVVDDGLCLRLTDEPMENYLRPSADPLFRTAGRAFGRECTAVVLTGLGCDGSQGAAEVHARGGTVLAQDPAQAVTPSMPASVLKLGLTAAGQSLDQLAQTISSRIAQLR